MAVSRKDTMKAKIKLLANFSLEFAEVEYTPEIEAKMNVLAEALRANLLKVSGMEPKADIHWQVEIQQPKLYEL